MPNVRADGLEIVFSSNRGGNMDIYSATRTSVTAAWSAPQLIANANINTGGSETRASLSADGTRLYFGRKVDAADPGDVFVATRTRLAAAQPTSTPAIGSSVLVLFGVLLMACAWFIGSRLGGFDKTRD
jgi:Tol biopolymer transport system component